MKPERIDNDRVGNGIEWFPRPHAKPLSEVKDPRHSSHRSCFFETQMLLNGGVCVRNVGLMTVGRMQRRLNSPMGLEDPDSSGSRRSSVSTLGQVVDEEIHDIRNLRTIPQMAGLANGTQQEITLSQNCDFLRP